MQYSPLDYSLDLMRRLPPHTFEENLGNIISLCPSITEDLLSSVDQPLKIKLDPQTKKEYLLCDYNRDGDSYRCPWTNQYDPALADASFPSQKLREMEVDMNSAFEVYRDLYYAGGVSSVYLWDLKNGFAGVILIKKRGDGGIVLDGSWDSIHVIEVTDKIPHRQATYKVTSTIILWFETANANNEVKMGGSFTRSHESNLPVSVNDEHTHIANIGRIIEDQENKMRDMLKTVYFSKTRSIVGEMRQVSDAISNETRQEFLNELSTNFETRKTPSGQ
uniref:F-actin-capping protein subunit beta n=1 Tax=Rhabditophanes sp. KR3021 TaxID=114890 RepID=A0AC35U7Z6_9BILA